MKLHAAKVGFGQGQLKQYKETDLWHYRLYREIVKDFNLGSQQGVRSNYICILDLHHWGTSIADKPWETIPRADIGPQDLARGHSRQAPAYSNSTHRLTRMDSKGRKPGICSVSPCRFVVFEHPDWLGSLKNRKTCHSSARASAWPGRRQASPRGRITICLLKVACAVESLSMTCRNPRFTTVD